MKERDMGIVYSTEHGRMCPECGKPAGECACKKKNRPPTGDGVVMVSRETKGRKGKGVTLITGIPADEARLKVLGKELKARCRGRRHGSGRCDRNPGRPPAGSTGGIEEMRIYREIGRRVSTGESRARPSRLFNSWE